MLMLSAVVVEPVPRLGLVCLTGTMLLKVGTPANSEVSVMVSSVKPVVRRPTSLEDKANPQRLAVVKDLGSATVPTVASRLELASKSSEESSSELISLVALSPLVEEER